MEWKYGRNSRSVIPSYVPRETEERSVRIACLLEKNFKEGHLGYNLGKMNTGSLFPIY
jgi:hypothetical protein